MADSPAAASRRPTLELPAELVDWVRAFAEISHRTVEQVVEVTSPSNGDTGRTAKRRRHSQYGAPVYLLVDRQERDCTLFSQPGKLGYTHVEGPHPFGTPVHLPEPFGLSLDTGGF